MRSAKYNSVHILVRQLAKHKSTKANHNSNIGDQYSFKCNQNLFTQAIQMLKRSQVLDIITKQNREPITTKLHQKRPKYI